MKTLLKVVLLAVAFTALPSIARADCPTSETSYEMTSGEGMTLLHVCITERGSIRVFESPVGSKLIGGLEIAPGQTAISAEGFGFCDFSGGNKNYFDYQTFNLGFTQTGPDPIVHQPQGPGTFPLTVIRTSDDRVWTVIQTFSLHKTYPPSLQVKLTLRNNTGTARFANLLQVTEPQVHSVNPAPPSTFNYNLESAFAFNWGITGLYIQNPNPSQPVSLIVTPSEPTSACNTLNPAPPNFVGFGTIVAHGAPQSVPPHSSVTLTLLYKRM
jgi:hypothetical protein